MLRIDLEMVELTRLRYLYVKMTYYFCSVELKCIFHVLYWQAHPWFKGVEWDKLYESEAAFKPEVNGELDTQNFMKFDEVCFNVLN